MIGQGGMGFVYQVRQPALDRTVALKILAPELGRDPAFAERFAREARTLGKLNHPNIVAVHEHGESGGFFYLVMEYVDGVNLHQAMRAGRFTPEQALAIVPPLCDALQAAHAQGIWHRDIKPENILLDREGKVKIADFGIARLVGDPQRDFTLTLTGGVLGSAAYMAPEQHEKPHDVDHRADLYSLGVVIYEMLTGELPLGRFPAPSQRAAVNARIDEIVLRTLEKERELRQQSAAEVKTEVENASTTSPRKSRTPQPEAMGYGKLAFGLFLASILGTLVLLALSHRDEIALVFGGVAMLLAFIFGIMGRSSRFGRFVVVALGLLLGTLIVFTGIAFFSYLPAREKALLEREKAEAIARLEQTRAENAKQGPEEVMEKALEAAKAGDLDALRELCSEAMREVIDGDENTEADLNDLASMEIVGVRWIRGDQAKIDLKWRRPDGSESDIDVDLVRENGDWKLEPEERAPAHPEPGLPDEIGPEWRVVEGGREGEKERVTTLRGPLGSKATKGGQYYALTIHIAGHPILIVIANSLDGLHLGTSSDRVQGQIGLRNFHLTEANRATLDQDTYDLTRGRVFLQGSDGTFRQISGRPDRILSGEDLKLFVEDLPAE
nr:serine/threonine-protein kinase [Luteolibacter marinus]